MRILGVDPGLDITGYGIIDDANGSFRLLEAGIIKTSPKQPTEKRLAMVYRGICELITRYKPKTIVLEQLYSHYKHPITAILMGHSRGVICLAGAENKLSIVNYPAKRIKKAVCGNGNASKDQVQRMVQHLLGVSEAKIPSDVTDALAAAITYSYMKRIEDDIPYLRKSN